MLINAMNKVNLNELEILLSTDNFIFVVDLKHRVLKSGLVTAATSLFYAW